MWALNIEDHFVMGKRKKKVTWESRGASDQKSTQRNDQVVKKINSLRERPPPAWQTGNRRGIFQGQQKVVDKLLTSY